MKTQFDQTKENFPIILEALRKSYEAVKYPVAYELYTLQYNKRLSIPLNAQQAPAVPRRGY